MDNQPTRQLYYKIVYFLVANQVVFKRLAVVLLILLNIILWWLNGVRIVNYWVSGTDYQRMLSALSQNVINWSAYRSQHQAWPLEVIAVNKVKTSAFKYDLVAKVRNPNFNWQARQVNYAFVLDGFLLDWQTDFILPGQDKYLFHFSYFSKSSPVQIDLKLGNIHWQPVKEKNRLEIINDILVENKNFEAGRNISQVKFEAANKTHFSFWQVGWQIVLYQGEHPLAINYVTTNNFLSGESRHITANWGESVSPPAKIEVRPDIDIFDETNYITEIKVPPVNLIKGAKTQK